MDASNPAATVPQANIDALLEQFVIPEVAGISICFVLCGICLPKLYDYYSHFPQDLRRNKVAVSIAALGVVTCIVLQIHFMMRVGSQSRTIANITIPGTDLLLLTGSYAIAASPAQAILAERAWRLNHRNKLLGLWLIFTISTSSTITIAILSYTFFARNNLLVYGSALLIIAPANLITNLVTDLSIVFGISIGLQKTSERLQLGENDVRGIKLIKAALITSIEAAILPTLLNVVGVILRFIRPNSMLFSSATFVLTPVYCFTLLFSLERRRTHTQISPTHRSLPTTCLRRLITAESSPVVVYGGEKSQKVSIAVVLNGEDDGCSERAQGSSRDEENSTLTSLEMRKMA